MWLQRDWGEGPWIRGRRTQLFCAWLAWSRFRVVIPVWDQQLGTLTWCVDQAPRAVTRICRADLIVVDIGMLPAGQDAAEAFYRITDAAYERRSVAVTSNIHPSGFDTIMPKTLATATVDRLMHHAHLVLTRGAPEAYLG
jgi:hypothetical protein